MTNAQFYFTLSGPLVAILVNVILITMLSHRVDGVENRLARLEGRLHSTHDLQIGKIGELYTRIARLEERLAH